MATAQRTRSLRVQVKHESNFCSHYTFISLARKLTHSIHFDFGIVAVQQAWELNQGFSPATDNFNCVAEREKNTK